MRRHWRLSAVVVLVAGTLAVTVPLATSSATGSPQQTIVTVERFLEAKYPSHVVPRPLTAALESSVLHDHDHIDFVNAHWLLAHPSATGVVGVAAAAHRAGSVELFVQAAQLGLECFAGIMQGAPNAHQGEPRWAVVNGSARGTCTVPHSGLLTVRQG